MRRRALTLVEVLVAVAIGALLLSVITDLFYKGSSLLVNSHQHLEAATGAQLLMERIHADLRRVKAPGAGSLPGGGPPLSLTVATPGSGTETVSYALVAGPSPGTSLVSRNGRIMRAVVLKQLVIRPETPSAAVGYPIFGYQVMILATDSQGRKDFPLVGFTAVDAPTRRLPDDPWVPNP